MLPALFFVFLDGQTQGDRHGGKDGRLSQEMTRRARIGDLREWGVPSLPCGCGVDGCVLFRGGAR